MILETRIYSLLSNVPVLKKIVKRIYQFLNVLLSKPRKCEGDVDKVTPDDGYEYLFGYYDKSPWDKTNRYLLALRVKNATKTVAPSDFAEIVLIDTEKNNSMKIIATTNTWNVQQGCMLGWLGPDYDKKIFYNDFRNGNYCGIIKDIKKGTEKIFDRPFYSVSNDGRIALSLDFSRLHRLRPGYGYSNLEDKTKNEKLPSGSCVWKIDLKTGKVESILAYKQLYDFEYRSDMEGASHKVNHLMLSPDGKRFMLIHRWLDGGKKISRLLTCDVDGKNLYNLSDENMISHCYWKNNKEILAYCRKDKKNGYFLMKDKTSKFEQKWEFLNTDGHPSYSPDGKLVATDTYPNKKRISTIRVLSDSVSTIVAKVYSPFKYDNDKRCDLHPRWSRDGKKICFDGCFEGKRAVYIIELGKNVLNSMDPNEKLAGKKKIVYLMTSCRKSGPTNQTLNIIKNLDRERFNPILVTIYEENDDTMINDFLPYVSAHYTILIGKKSIIMKKTKKMKKFLDKIKPDLIHSVGVFPNYLVSKIGFENHIFTLRNYAYEDYPVKFGKVRGKMLAKMQIAAIKNTKMVVSCSKSLQEIYENKLSIRTQCVQNGVDLNKYIKLNKTEKQRLKRKMGFSKDDFLWIYSGQFIDRKNIPFMIDGFLKASGKNDKLVMLGDGDKFAEIKEYYASEPKLVFAGAINNVNDYLNIGDVYVSASRSEGLPNGVLEAMACGLPVLLSDIPQHKELIGTRMSGGFVFRLDDVKDYEKKIREIRKQNLEELGDLAYKNIKENFDGVKMSWKYQNLYNKILFDASEGRRKKVMHFVGGMDEGGAQNLIKNYLKNLDREKFDVLLLCLGHVKDSLYENELASSGIKVIYADQSSPFKNSTNPIMRTLNHFYRYPAVRRIIGEEKPDIIHTHLMVNPYVKFARPVANTVMVYTVHSDPKRIWSSEANLRERNDLRVAKWLVEHYKMKFIVLHEAMKKDVNQIFDINNAIILNNGIEIDRYKKSENRKRQIRKKLKIPINAFVVGHIGRMVKVKNQGFLLDTFEKIVENNKKAFLLMVGDGPERGILSRQICEHGLSNRCIILSNRDDVPELLQAMDVFLLPSHYEGIPLVLIEAQEAGLPCFISDTISDYVIISNLVNRLSLSDGASKWADYIMNYKKPKETVLSDKDWDIKKVTKKLEQVYLDVINDDKEFTNILKGGI